MLSRPLLRHASRVILETKCGYRIADGKKKQGVAEGVRLLATKGLRTEHVAVRTSRSRSVRLVRHKNERWRTIADVDLVVVAVPGDRKSTMIEVIGFEPSELMDFFDAVTKKPRDDLEAGFPVVVPLDKELEREVGGRPASLRSRAKWSYVVPWDDPCLTEPSTPRSAAGFIERVKREFAALNGVDPSKVVVEFKIIS